MKQTVSTPVYHQLATHGAHIHAISLPVFQQSTTQISPLTSQDSWSTSVPPPPSPPLTQQEPMASLPNPHSPPISSSNGGSPPIRSSSLHATSQVLSAATAVPRSASPVTILANAGGNNKIRFGNVDHIERRNPSVAGAVGILTSLEPPKKDGALTSSGLGSGGTGSWGTIPADEREGRHLGSVSDLGHGGQSAVDKEKDKKKGFWSVRDRDREREREKEREREQREREREVQLKKERHEREHRERGRDISRREEDSGELTRMIGVYFWFVRIASY